MTASEEPRGPVAGPMVIGAATPIVVVHGVSERAACDCDLAAPAA